jgi:hypothetical protein
VAGGDAGGQFGRLATALRAINPDVNVVASRVLLVDGLRMRFRTINVPRDAAHRARSTHEISTLIDAAAFCGADGEPHADALG